MFEDFETIHVDVGDRVICDGCSKDWTDSPESGGIFGLMTKAFCPECGPRVDAQAKVDGEDEYIFGRCPPEMSFADWVRNVVRKGGCPRHAQKN